MSSSTEDWFSDAGKFAGDMLGLGPNSYSRGLTAAATKLAETLDLTVSNTYVESGWADVQKTKPNVRNVITQNPDLIVLIKKRMFSSLKSNFSMEHMDDTERSFLLASKKLFENKCKEISAYEKLTKIEKIVKQEGLNSGLVSSILDTIDQVEGVASWSGLLTNSPQMSSFKQVTSKIRDLLLLSGYNTTTTWVENTKFPSTYTGAGTGVIELTMVTTFNSITSVKFGAGSANFTIVDPNRLFAITEQDIERAIFETSDSKFNLMNGLADTLEKEYNQILQSLNAVREQRGASTVSVITNPYNKIYNRIIIMLDRYGIELTSPDGNGLRDDLFAAATEEDALTAFEGLINVVSSPPGKKTIPVNPNAKSLAQTESFQNDEFGSLKKLYDKAIMISTLREKDFVDFCDYGQRSNYVRRSMRQNFLGKQIIQPMDIVTAFITSRTIEDNAALAGLKGMFSISDSAISAVTDITRGVGAITQWVGDKLDDNWLETAGGDIINQAGINDQYTREQVAKARSYMNQGTMDVTNMSRGNGGNILGALNKNIGDLKELWGGVFGTNKINYALEAEKNMLAGPDFPMYLYLSLRSYFGASDYGPCTFNGVVLTANESGSAGNYTVSVTCKDNCYYFEQGMYQETPALNQFNGHLYDPLTPFDTEFDEATGKTNLDSNFKLLDENLALIQSGVLKYKFGRFVNQNVTDKNIHQTALEEMSGASDSAKSQANYNLLNASSTSVVQDIARKIFYNPDGFVYRWKKGIGTTWMVSNSRNQAGSVLTEERQDNQVANIIRTDPFSGQDVVNIISLLITGEPYNLTTFINASIENHTLIVVPGQTSHDYIESLTRLIRKQNQIWGSFVPFKRQSVNPSLFNKLFTAQLTLTSQSKKISDLQTRKATLMDKLIVLDSSFSNLSNLDKLQGFNITKGVDTTITLNNAAAFPLIRQIVDLDNEIKSAQAKITDVLSQDSTINIFANDIYYSYDSDINASKESKLAYKAAFNRLRLKQNFLSQRKLWQVKSNTDTNLFIVCDEYDHDTDIQGMVQSLGNLTLINSKAFTTVKAKVDAASKIVGMEIFANSQGHIELRIPQYNKVPSSLFFKMAERKRKFGIQYYPTFLEKTFKNRLDNAYDEIEQVEDWIRIYTTVIGYDEDRFRATFLGGSNNPTKNLFTFITDESTGSLISLRAATSQIAIDFTDDYETTKTISVTTSSKGDFFERNLNDDFISSRYNYFNQDLTRQGVSNASVIAAALKSDSVKPQVTRLQQAAFQTTNNFDVMTQVTNLSDLLFSNLSPTVTDASSTLNQKLSILLARQSQRTGTKIDTPTFIKGTLTNSKTFFSPSDLLNIEKKLAQFVSQRYKAILSATNLIKNLDQSARANSNDSSALASIMLPNLVKDGDIPDFMSHMIEDETEDDYGFQSGKRFIIRPQDVISSTYQEQAPEFTAIKVQGAAAGGLVSGAGFDVGSGMEIKSVWATDYDLWRMYGFKDGAERYLPFLSDIETQIAPYAKFLLNQQRSALLHASVTRVGNEFIQPGEVYYMEDRDLLFYCEQVTQSFTYGSPGSFQTTMALTYGHTIGEYIPTPMDVIGKSISKGHYSGGGSFRMSNPAGVLITPNLEIPLGAIVFAQKPGTPMPDSKELAAEVMNSGEFAAHNRNTLVDILYKVKNIMTSNAANTSSSQFATVSMRVYHTDSSDYNSSLRFAATYISEYLQNPDTAAGEEKIPLMRLSRYRIVGGEADDEISYGVLRSVKLNANLNNITTGSFQGVRNPSAQAIELAKKVAASNRGLGQAIKGFFTDTETQTNVKAKQIETALLGNIIDVWVEFINPEEAKIKVSPPFTSTNIKQAESDTSKVNIDDFYKGVKITDTGYQASNGQTITITYKPPTS